MDQLSKLFGTLTTASLNINWHSSHMTWNIFQSGLKPSVHHYQFPICLAYAITIHKSRGLSLPNALLDVDNLIFSCNQVYVILYRVTSLQEVLVINFDPCPNIVHYLFNVSQKTNMMLSILKQANKEWYHKQKLKSDKKGQILDSLPKKLARQSNDIYITAKFAP